MKVTFIGQSTFLLEASGETLIIDPAWLARIGPLFIGTPAYRRAGRPLRDKRLRGVLHTHTHIDHFDPRTLRALRRALASDAPLVFPALALPFLKHGRNRLARLADAQSAQLLPFVELSPDLLGRARYLSDRATMRIGPFNVTAVPMDHGYEVHGVRPVGCGYIVESGGRTVYHAGDCVFNLSVAAAVAEMCGRPDLMLVPVGFFKPRYNNPRDAAQLTAAVRPRAVTPMHFGVPWERPQESKKRSAADEHAWHEALQRVDLGLNVPLLGRPFLYGTLPEFAAELPQVGSAARLCPLDRGETLDLASLG